jgi:hypothetical protein
MKSPFIRTWGALAFALAVLVSQSAWATTPIGTQGFSDSNTPTANNSDITLATSFSLGGSNLFASTGSQTGLFAGVLADGAASNVAMGKQSFGPLTLAVNPTLFSVFSTSAFTFNNAVFGTFTSASTELIAVVHGTNASVTYLVEGSWSAGTVASASVRSGNPYAASMTIAITQTGGPGSAIGDTATFAVPAVQLVPEPSTMGLAGLGALGLIGYGLRRRKASGA